MERLRLLYLIVFTLQLILQFHMVISTFNPIHYSKSGERSNLTVIFAFNTHTRTNDHLSYLKKAASKISRIITVGKGAVEKFSGESLHYSPSLEYAIVPYHSSKLIFPYLLLFGQIFTQYNFCS